MTKEELRELAQRIVKVVYDEDNYYEAYERIEIMLEDYANAADIESIESILEEANGYGLRYEVDYTAKKFMKEDSNLSKLKATEMAYNEWIK